MSQLLKEMKEIEDKISALKDKGQQLIVNAEITDEHLAETLNDWRMGTDRFVLILPDGSRFWGWPGRGLEVSTFNQRPAALRRAKNGLRVLDRKTGEVLSA